MASAIKEPFSVSTPRTTPFVSTTVTRAFAHAASAAGYLAVRCFGTEGRRAKDNLPEVPAAADVFEYIMFRGSDIQDLTVCEANQAPQAPPPDPAIVSVVNQLAPPNISSCASTSLGSYFLAQRALCNSPSRCPTISMSTSHPNAHPLYQSFCRTTQREPVRDACESPSDLVFVGQTNQAPASGPGGAPPAPPGVSIPAPQPVAQPRNNDNREGSCEPAAALSTFF